MKLFLFIIGTNFTTNISDAFLLTVSIYRQGRRPGAGLGGGGLLSILGPHSGTTFVFSIHQ